MLVQRRKGRSTTATATGQTQRRHTVNSRKRWGVALVGVAMLIAVLSIDQVGRDQVAMLLSLELAILGAAFVASSRQ